MFDYISLLLWAIMWCLFITSSSPYVPRPWVPARARIPRPRASEAPQPQVPRPTSQSPSPRPTFRDSCSYVHCDCLI